MNNSFSDYTEAQFIRLMQEIFTANNNGTPDDVLGELLDQFCKLAEHPDGTDLIYYPESEDQCTPEGITETVKKWREANGLPGFKPRF
ncbi:MULTISPECIES: bacteriocin immunity protein [unclassified Pseudomonas]|uniref:bacteriocin immunity protein n=1 Tax=unclassified Pseudomonas TaxID=196821 RepID=UPI002AC91887|nr:MULTISPECIES: bacteriocin immunity protein [unclassified Pseudomonas]MEB0048830.1 bacteriocin immunity protein [Pseudomonas sp. Dout3]MEB0098239.1 bacteriocin immunity protein [Pseudomonas sp. DC1.2]WPX59197.1 bacteriocin immunity protein [Pseudomonas sp. DC1.2]